MPDRLAHADRLARVEAAFRSLPERVHVGVTR